jgi:uncharacterized protein
MTEITKSLEIIDLALYYKKENTLIISDTHIGLEESLNKQGMLIPRFQFKEIMKRLEVILEKLPRLNKVIINGDIKHEFGTISEQEWRLTLRLLDFLALHAESIVLIKGNHDTILGPIAQKRNVTIVDHMLLGNSILITHGDKIPKIPKGIKTIIIGHEHPALSLRDGARVETVKCFLKGTYKKMDLIVLPSFNLVHEGTDVLKEDLFSPFLDQDISRFEVFVVADKVYDFGKIKDI